MSASQPARPPSFLFSRPRRRGCGCGWWIEEWGGLESLFPIRERHCSQERLSRPPARRKPAPRLCPVSFYCLSLCGCLVSASRLSYIDQLRVYLLSHVCTMHHNIFFIIFFCWSEMDCALWHVVVSYGPTVVAGLRCAHIHTN